jgi:hypothetical protein
MQPSTSWEVNSCSATQETSSILWNSEVHYYGLYPEPDESSPYSLPVSLRSVFILFFHLCLGLPSGFFLSRFYTNTLYALVVLSVRATYPAPLILDLIILILFGEEYKLWSSSLCRFIQFCDLCTSEDMYLLWVLHHLILETSALSG